MTLDNQQQAAVDAMQAGSNVFLSGMAGTGKSTTLLAFVASSFRSCDVCSSTGIAALNLQDKFRETTGVAGSPGLCLPAWTIYRWAGMMTGAAEGQSFTSFADYLDSQHGAHRRAARARIARCETLVIDEISMLPARVLDFLDFYMKRVRGDGRPFGGVQVVVVGDFLQLPPVAKNGCYDWAFAGTSWKAARFENIFLRHIHRQAGGEQGEGFISALNGVREGRVSSVAADTFARRVKLFVPRDVVRLKTHNAQVDRWNSYQLGEIEGAERVYEATFCGRESERDMLAKSSITPTRLVLKVGARVMVTQNVKMRRNDGSETTVVNGQCGEVAELLPSDVAVRLDNGEVVTLGTYTRSWNPQDDESATMSQVPLRLAYAMTIHKSQGLTLDRAYIDVRAAREPGQAYVALSRLRGLGGLYLREAIRGVFVSDAAIDFYRKITTGGLSA